MTIQPTLFDAPPSTKHTLDPNGWSVKGCSIIYAPRGQAGEYSKLATNPYRGCGHKCAYCLDGDTLVQMAGGTSKAIRDIEVGDEVVGVFDTGDNNRAWNNRVAVTTVLAKVVSQKEAYKITLEDGSVVICSADHRWLTDRGWKYTVGSMSGANQRPHLTTSTDWESYTHRILELVNRLGVKHYIKKDLQRYLPEGYRNPQYIPQHHGSFFGIGGS